MTTSGLRKSILLCVALCVRYVLEIRKHMTGHIGAILPLTNKIVLWWHEFRSVFDAGERHILQQ